MLGHDYYHESIRKYVIYFGTLFNDLKIKRRDTTGNVIQNIKVPVNYAPREKITSKLEGNLDLQNQEAILLPRISFEMVSLQYAAERKLNTLNRYTNVDAADGGKKKSMYQPVPYDINFDLNIYVKYAEDATQLLEQILPFFTPEWTGTLNLIPEMGVKMDIPVVLQSMSSQDTYEGDYDTRRALIWNLNFVMKAYMFGPITSSSVIKQSNVNFFTANSTTGYANTPAAAVNLSPGLDQFRNPTTNAAASIAVGGIFSNDNYSVIADFEDYFNGEDT
tara:strand:- start:48 stop:878 length:831 start_codon:yes stop_codon:yes gene_type:complete